SPLRTLRRVLVIVCALAAVAWGGFALIARSERIYNPGAVAAVHASFESECWRCHDGGRMATTAPAGQSAHWKFSKSVSDGASVRAFDEPPAHPSFGRLLRQGGERMVDPTPLKFNHKKHLVDINQNLGDCSTCHRLSDTGARRIMQPVSFDAHCKSCHPLSLA